jgi:type IX secretion system PorP/SprF family membrane protein
MLLSPLTLLAQQDPQFSQYMMNPYIWNPSVPALKNDYTFSLHDREQWVGYAPTNSADKTAAPSTQLFTAIAPLQKLNSGVGISIMNDNIGPLRNLNTTVSYAYGMKLGSGKIAVGVGGGLQAMYINTNLWRPEVANDPTLTSISNTGTVSRMDPNFRLGLGYATDRLYVGISTNNVFNPTYSYSGQLNSQLERDYYLQAQYKIYISEKISVQPSTLIKSVAGINSAELSSLVFTGVFWAGLAYRTSDAVTFLAGMSLLPDKSLKIGYNMDLTVLSESAKSLTSHEIFLSYNFGSVLDNRKPIIRTPRFRF